MARIASRIGYIVDIWDRKERNDSINAGCNFSYHIFWLDHDPGSINSIVAGQYAIRPMLSQYTGHSIGVWIGEKQRL